MIRKSAVAGLGLQSSRRHYRTTVDGPYLLEQDATGVPVMMFLQTLYRSARCAADGAVVRP